MNRNLKGEILTTAELITIAKNNGLWNETIVNQIADLHNENLVHSLFLTLTRSVRFAMMGRGELYLDTSGRSPKQSLAWQNSQ